MFVQEVHGSLRHLRLLAQVRVALGLFITTHEVHLRECSVHAGWRCKGIGEIAMYPALNANRPALLDPVVVVELGRCQGKRVGVLSRPPVQIFATLTARLELTELLWCTRSTLLVVVVHAGLLRRQ